MKKTKTARPCGVQTTHPTIVQSPKVTAKTASAWAGAIGEWLRLGFELWQELNVYLP